MSQPQNTALAERIEGRIDRSVMNSLAIGGEGARTPTFASMSDVLEFAKVMAVSGIAVREHLRNNPGACVAITLQAMDWQMSPFTVGNKSYSVNNQLAYEAQLIVAVVNKRAPIKGRLKTRFVGEGQNRKCIASATFIGEDEPTEVVSPAIGSITPKNSPLWKTDPDQQLAYYTKRLWARRECPEVLLGVYDVDELGPSQRGPETARDVTPPRPRREDFRETGQGALIHPGISEPADDGELDAETFDPETGEVTPDPAVTVVAVPMRDGAGGKKIADWMGYDAAVREAVGKIGTAAGVEAFRDANHDNFAALFKADEAMAADLAGFISDRAQALA